MKYHVSAFTWANSNVGSNSKPEFPNTAKKYNTYKSSYFRTPIKRPLLVQDLLNI